MSLKMILNNKKEMFYIDTSKIEAIKGEKVDGYYYVITVYTENNEIRVVFNNKNNFMEALNRLKESFNN